MNPDAAKLWVGRTFRCFHKMGPVHRQVDSEVLEFLGFGNTYAVFSVLSDDGRSVIKVPRNHIAFTIHLPPSKWFPEFESDPSYERSLVDRIVALQGSPALSLVAPLDALWTGLAVQHLAGIDKSEQTISLADYDALATCEFVLERLADWAAADAGRSESELADIMVIYQYERPIHATLPQILAQQGAQALERLKNTTPVVVGNNPYLPWLSAGVTGYRIPECAAELVAVALRESCSGVDECVRQAGQVLGYAARPHSVGWDEMLQLVHFVIESAKKADSKHRGKELITFMNRHR